MRRSGLEADGVVGKAGIGAATMGLLGIAVGRASETRRGILLWLCAIGDGSDATRERSSSFLMRSCAGL
jgi:hypothetical protein